MAENIGLEAVFDMSGWSRNVDSYIGDTGKAEKATSSAAGKMGKAWSDLGSATTKAAAVMGGAMVTAAAAAGAAVTGFVVGGIQKAADLEQGISRIAAALNITKEQVGPLKQLINNLGLDPNLKVTATEAAEAIENLAKNGLSMQQILDGAARSTVLLANATGADFGQAADIATDVMGVFNIKAEDMMSVVDGITAVTNLSKFSIDDYALALSQGGGVASMVGMEFEDFNTTLAAIPALFGSGSDAGTSLKTTMMRLIPTTNKAYETFSELGLLAWNQTAIFETLASAGIKPVSDNINDAIFQLQDWFEVAYKTDLQTEEGILKFQKWSGEVGLLKNQFFDLNGNFKSMAEVTSILHEATKNLSEEQRNEAFNTMFGSDAMRAAFGIADAGAVIYTDVAKAARELGVSQEEVNKVIEGGVTQFEALQLQMSTIDAEEQARTRMENFRGAMEILGSVIEAVQIQIGDFFLPILTELAKSFTGISSQYGPAVTAYFQSLATSISDLVRYVGEFITTGEPFNQFFDDLSPTLQSVVLGIGALVLAFQSFSDLIANTIGQFVSWKDVLIVLGTSITATVVPAIGLMLGSMAPMALVFAGATLAVAGLRYAWETNFLGIQDITYSAMQAVTEAMGPTIAALTDLAQRVIPFAQQHWQELAAAVAGFAIVLLAAQIPAMLSAIGTAAAVAAGAITALNLPLLAAAAAVGIFAAAWTGNWFGIQETTYAVVEQVKVAFNDFVASLSGTMAGVASAFEQAKGTVETFVLSFGQTLAELTPPMDVAKGMVETFAVSFGAHLPGALKEITNFVTGNKTEFTHLSSIWEDAKTAADGLFGDIVAFAGKYLGEWTSKLTEWGEAALDWIVEAAGQVATRWGEWYVALSAALTSRLSVWRTAFNDWITASWQWIVNAAGLVGGKLGEWYASLASALSSRLTAWKNAFTEWITASWQWLVTAAGQVGAKLGGWYTALASALSGRLASWKDAFTEWIVASWQWLVNAVPLVGSKLGDWYSSLSSKLSGLLSTWKMAFVEWAAATWQWLADAGAGIGAKLGEWYEALTGNLNGYLTQWKDAFTDWIDATWQWLDDASNEVNDKLGDWYSALETGLSNKLPEWQAAFVEWQKAAGQWLIDAGANLASDLGKWFVELVSNLDQKIPQLKIEMLKFATVMVTWLGDKAADALPELGKWLGRILAWIPLGVIGLAAGMVKMAGALIGWIAGGEGVAENQSAAGQTDEAMQAFQTALITALGQIQQGFIEAVQAFADEWAKTMNEYVDWRKVGQDILNSIREGWESVRDAVYMAVELTVDGVIRIFTETDWAKLGKDAINFIRDGVSSMASALVSRVGQLAKDAGNAFLNFDWAGLGADIINGLLQGLKNNAGKITDYMTGLAQSVWDTVTGVFWSHSPSRRMMMLGRDIIAGWVIGLQQEAPALQRAISQISENLLDTVKRGQQSAVKGFSGVLGSLFNAGDPFAEAQGRRQLSTPTLLRGSLTDYNKAKEAYELLKAQADLVETIRGSGGDPGAILGHMRLGRDANPALILKGVTEATKRLTLQLEESLQVATRGYDGLVNSLRSERKSVSEIEAQFQQEHLSGLDVFRRRINDIDERIAATERDLLTHGNEDRASALRGLQDVRRRSVREMEEYLAQWRQLNVTVGSIQSTTFQRLQESIDKFRKAQIQPLIDEFQLANTDPRSRDAIVRLLNERARAIDAYIANADDMLAVEQSVNRLLDSATLSTSTQNSLTGMLEALFDVGRSDRDAVSTRLQNYVFWAQRAVDAFGKLSSDDPLTSQVKKEQIEPLLNRLLDVNLAMADRIQLTEQYRLAMLKVMGIQSNQRGIEDIQERLDLIDKVRKLATDLNIPSVVEQIFSDIDLTKSLSPEDLATVFARYTDYAVRLANQQLQESLRPRVDVEPQLAALRRQRETFEQIQDDFASAPFSQLERFRTLLAEYDQLIANSEQQALETGNQSYVDMVRRWTENRQLVVDQTREYLRQVYMANAAIARIAMTADEQGAQAAEAFRTRYIDPLVGLLDGLGNVGSRNQLLLRINSQVDALNQFITRINQLSAIQKRMETQQSPMEAALGRFYDPASTDAQRQGILRYMEQLEDLNVLQTQASRLFGTLADRFRDETLERLLAPLDSLSMSEAQRQRRMEAITMYIGQFRELQFAYGKVEAAAANLDERFDSSVSDNLLTKFFNIQDPVDQSKLIDSVLLYSGQLQRLNVTFGFLDRTLANSPLAERDISQLFLDRFFDTTTTEAQRGGVLASLEEYTTQFRSLTNVYGQLSSAVESSPLGEMDISGSFLDRFFKTETTGAERAQILASLDAYARQFKILAGIKLDVSDAIAINPLVSRFETEVMDQLLAQFFDLNTSEEQRLQIAQQYRQEQEKLLALQQKQRQLDFLQQQLDLYEQVTQLNEEFGDQVALEDILSGIEFGLDASLDDMLLFTSRSIDAMIAVVKHQLGIASPSKVFAEIGGYMMEGLGQGIWDSRQYPTMAMAAAAQQVPYALTNNRSLVVNMGGVTNNNGMDDVMFEARVRQIVEGML